MLNTAYGPMEGVTYSLLAGGNSPDDYYTDVRRLADAVVSGTTQRVGSLVGKYRLYRLHTGRAPLTPAEHGFELLALGVLWQVYGARAQSVTWMTCTLLTQLARIRRHGGRVKSKADSLRGYLLTRALSRPLQGERNERNDSGRILPTLQNLGKLVRWLAATGDFTQEAAHFSGWVAFFRGLAEEQAACYLGQVQELAAWFAQLSAGVLGCYTEGVDRFLAEEQPSRQGREDVVFCGRSRVEYHLNMVGAEIMNRAFRPAFARSARQRLLLPGCMCAKPEGECKATVGEFGRLCRKCTRDCRVHQLTRQGELEGFSVFIASHESEVLSPETACQLQKDGTGIVGVACVPNLLSGGWKLQAHGIPAQCVLLNCSGCKRHWHPAGQVTDLSQQELARVLGTKLPPQPGCQIAGNMSC